MCEREREIHTVRLSWAQLTGKSPALAGHHAAAALGLGGVQSFGDGTFSCLEFGETEALPGICREKKKKEVHSVSSITYLHAL